MFSALRTKFGIPGVISVIALVFALTGSAFAAKYIITSKGQIKPSVLKSLKGAKGDTGAAGANGAAGQQGPQGPQGSPGKDGNAGTSVTATEFATTEEGHCTVGGSKFTAGATKTYACNGKNGTTGFTDTLPSGKTETGVWDVNTTAAAIKFATMSYSIPLEAAPTTVTVVQVGETGVTGCPGTEPLPSAEPGFLCLYVVQTDLATVNAFPALNTGAGASIGIPIFVEAGGFARGTWAVTAE